MLNIQIVSDLHIEFWGKKQKFNFIKPTAPILALLGDICCCGSNDDFEIFKRFINEIVPLYETIIMISGNHEYYYNPDNNIEPVYENTMQGIDERIKTFFKLTSPKLHYLNNSTIKLNDNKQTYTIIGSTLWSWIPEEQRDFITTSMNDYKYIKILDSKKIRNLSSNDIANTHMKNFKYIKTQISKAKKAGHKIIIFTHHKPYLSPEYNPKTISIAYESDLSDLFEHPVALWAYGHTHIADNSVQGKTWLYSNPKGYPNQKTKYDKKANIKV